MTIHDPAVTPEQRAEIIAGLRAMAQFLEDRPEVPCPQNVREQHSFLEPLDTSTWERVPVPDAEKIRFVQSVAAMLGVEAQITDRSVSMEYAVAARTTYTVHANLRGDGTAEAVTAR
jgi:hypothetical protein